MVEAQSLSSLSNLFANPPTYPRNPTHRRHEPLVLYILKVPGSQDVFLTPLKPPAKASVTLEGVQSCLYYLHVTTPEDEEVRKLLNEEKQVAEADYDAQLTPIARKPLPNAPFGNDRPSAPPLPARASAYPRPPELGESMESQAARSVARDRHLRLRTSSENNEAAYRPKPVGPRPFHSRLQSADAANPPRESVRSIEFQGSEIKHESGRIHRKPLPSVSVDTNQPLASDHPAQSVYDAHGDTQNQRFGLHQETPSSTAMRDWESWTPSSSGQFFNTHGTSQADFGHIVLIRRDPSSGSQWNVGTIIYKNSAAKHSSENSMAQVQIDTPGYRKFAYDHREEGRTSLMFGVNADATNTILAEDETNPPPSSAFETKAFVRRVNLAWRDKGQESYQRQRSDESTTISQAKGAFTSPWGGTCSFTTGVDGKSLKCRHSLPMNSSGGGDSTVGVAELRFNLPWVALKSRHVNKKEALRRGLRTLKRQTGSGSLFDNSGCEPVDIRGRTSTEETLARLDSESEDEDVLDMTLSREKAGGGFRGNSAKLGKLIIEDEGLKMADLVVASCMAVWWQHYLASRP